MSLPYHRALSREDQLAAGVQEPAAMAYADRVHHDDLDALLHVNNVTYMVWFERLRIRYMEEHGIGTIGDPNSPRIVVRNADIHYIAEMVRDEDYVITTRCTGYRRTSLTLEQVLWSGGTKRATLTAVMVLLEQDGSGRAPIPDHIKQKLQQIDGATQQA